MNKEKVIKQLENLASQIEYHDNLYYNNDLPEISDAEYDKLRLQNTNLETQFPELVLSNSPSNRVGVALTSSFKKVNHVIPMLSLGNTFTENEVEEYSNIDIRWTANKIYRFKYKQKKDIEINSSEYFSVAYIFSLAAPLFVNSTALIVHYANSQYDEGEDFVDHNNNKIFLSNVQLLTQN